MEQNDKVVYTLVAAVLFLMVGFVTVVLLDIVSHARAKTVGQEVIHTMKMKEQKLSAPAMMCGYIAAKNPTVNPEIIAEAVPLVFKLCEKHRINAYLVFAVIERECTFNFLTQPGQAGEHGPMQVTRAVFTNYRGVLGLTDIDFNDWRKTLEVGILHLSVLIGKYKNDNSLALSEYNAGQQEGWIKKADAYVRAVYAYHLNICVAQENMDKLKGE
jgi:hypothetical protein